MAVRALSQRKHAVGSIYTVTHAFNVAVSCHRRRRRRWPYLAMSTLNVGLTFNSARLACKLWTNLP
ncbi:hypothetical protein ALC60_04097 [Trachymyrmex zeteki]|uniref:Uncharacterized protein n=1 Tax=Mycetomoellerius zeteki TaxID=64791 RepID=A0A151X953_9HYME|nr:hypothetical protein ALC60_04097 [Trachymyrmex zeteki]